MPKRKHKKAPAAAATANIGGKSSGAAATLASPTPAMKGPTVCSEGYNALVSIVEKSV